MSAFEWAPDVSELVDGELSADVDSRIISGSVLGGRHIEGDAGPSSDAITHK